MKERELRTLKFKQLFDSPVRAKKDPDGEGKGAGGSFGAQSARAGAVGRSNTKTSDELTRPPFDGLPAAANG